MLLDQVAEQLEPALPGGGEADAGRPHGAPVARATSARNACRNASPSRLPCHIVPNTCPSGRRRAKSSAPGADGDAAVVDLVARTPARPAPYPPGSPSTLSGANSVRDVEQPEARRPWRPPRPRRRAGPRSVRPSIWKPPQIPSTGRPAARVGDHRAVQAAVAQPARGRRRSRGCPGRTTRSASARSRGSAGEDDVEPGLEAESVDVGEVADPGQAHDGDLERPARTSCRGGRPSRSSASSESSHRSGCHGSTP